MTSGPGLPDAVCGEEPFFDILELRRQETVLTLRDGLVELYKKVATSIPKDIEEALRSAHAAEDDHDTRARLAEILSKIVTSRTSALPLCTDSGHPVFFVRVPKGVSHLHIREVIEEATRLATRKIPLLPNAVDALTGVNSGDNVGSHFPLVYTEESDAHSLVVDLMLRGGDCEAQGRTYNLPCSLDSAGGGGRPVEAGRNLEGIVQCIRQAVRDAEGRICAPYILGVAVGGSRDHVAFLAKRQLLRRLSDESPVQSLAQLEATALRAVNEMHSAAIGRDAPLVLGVKATAAHRHPDSFFVDVSFACWAHRRARLVW